MTHVLQHSHIVVLYLLQLGVHLAGCATHTFILPAYLLFSLHSFFSLSLPPILYPYTLMCIHSHLLYLPNLCLCPAVLNYELVLFCGRYYTTIVCLLPMHPAYICVCGYTCGLLPSFVCLLLLVCPMLFSTIHSLFLFLALYLQGVAFHSPTPALWLAICVCVADGQAEPCLLHVAFFIVW